MAPVPTPLQGIIAPLRKWLKDRPPARRRTRSQVNLSTMMLLIDAFAMNAAGGPGNSKRLSPAGAHLRVSTDPGSDVPPSIPDKAMLHREDLRGTAPTTVQDATWARLLPPQPGAEDAYPSVSLRRGERAVSAVVRVDGSPTAVGEYVAVYHSNGAHRYLRDLRRALEACRGVDDQGGRWKILAARVAGPDSVLLRLREDVEHADEIITSDTYLAVARVGRVLVIVADAGRETAAGHRGLVEELITPAVRRASVML